MLKLDGYRCLFLTTLSHSLLSNVHMKVKVPYNFAGQECPSGRDTVLRSFSFHVIHPQYTGYIFWGDCSTSSRNNISHCSCIFTCCNSPTCPWWSRWAPLQIRSPIISRHKEMPKGDSIIGLAPENPCSNVSWRSFTFQCNCPRVTQLVCYYLGL